IDAVGAASENDAAQVIACPRLHGRGVVHDLAVDAGLAHAAGDELVVLASEIENDYLFQHISSSARRMAAPIRPMNKGCGRLGRDLNSGWNCTPTNHGWPFSSTASTNSRSGLTP